MPLLRVRSSESYLGQESKGHIIVKVIVKITAAKARRSAFPIVTASRRRAATAALIPAAVSATGAAARTAFGAIEHHQLAIKTADADFSGVAVIARLILPFARLQLAFNIDFAALTKESFGNTDKAVAVQSNAMPFGTLFLFTSCAVFPVFRCGDPQIADAPAILKALHFRVRAQIADQYYLIDASRHN